MNEKLEKFFNNKRNMWITVIIAAAVILGLIWLMQPVGPSEDIPIMEYAEYLKQLEDGNIDKIFYNKSVEYMTVYPFNGETRDMAPEEREKYEYPVEEAWRVKFPGGDTFRKDLLESGANPTMVTQEDVLNSIMQIISIFLYAGLGITLLVMMVKGPMGGLNGGKNNIVKDCKVRFSDVIGHDETIEDLKFIVELMKDPSIGKDIGARVPKGLLLQGPPGTGKTLLAKAVAGEAGVPFIQIAGSAFIEMYVGVGAKRVRDLFKLAEKNKPCIIFIDEIDAIGGKRDRAGGTSENDQTINALLERMDGFDARDGIFVIAATNRPDQLDEALIRPGRFDRQVSVNPPRDWQVRKALYEHHLKGMKLDEATDLETIARQTSGFTGADIAAICNEAGLIAAMARKPSVDRDCLEEAIDKKVFQGSRSKREEYERDKRTVATHEAGHAVMTWLTGGQISRAGIQGTTSGVGGAVFGADPNHMLMTKSEMESRVMVLYAGYIAEHLIYNDPSTGASNDITEATKLIQQYCERFGFSSENGLLDMSVLCEKRLLDGRSALSAIKDVSTALYERCSGKLQEKGNLEMVKALSDELLKEENIPGDRIEAMFRAMSENQPESN